MNKRKSLFVALSHEVLDSPAWCAMSHGARSLYIALRRRFNSTVHNNGRIFIAQRTAAKEIGSSSNQVARWFRELQHFGFIGQTTGGSLGLNGKGTAPHWRLTECGYLNDPPTREFANWDGTLFENKIRHRKSRNEGDKPDVTANRNRVGRILR